MGDSTGSRRMVTPPRKPSCLGPASGGRVGVGTAVDVGVPEVRRAVLLRCGRWDAGVTRLERGAPRIDRRAVGGVSGVVPYGRTVGACRGGVHVIPQELGDQCVR